MADIKTAYKTMTQELNDAMLLENKELKEQIFGKETDTIKIEGLLQTEQRLGKENLELSEENESLKGEIEDWKEEFNASGVGQARLNVDEEIEELKEENEDFKNGGVFKDLTEKIDRLEKEKFNYNVHLEERTNMIILMGKMKEEKEKIGMEHAVVADVVWNYTRDGDDCTEDMKKELIEKGGMGEWWEDEDE
jgi:FtsZ-binding cell division protein ZapB